MDEGRRYRGITSFRVRPATFCPPGASKQTVTRLCEITVARELRARACAGDEAAREVIYAALAPATFGLVRRLIGQRSAAEDVFQDTMMTFFERLTEFREQAPLGAWLRQIALSRCFMYLRSPWQRVRLCLESATDAAAPGGLALVTAAIAPEALDLERALATLTPTARAVVWMYEVEGYSHTEIAGAFGRSVSFSKSQLARAHARLRAWYEPEEVRQPCTPI
jgi:RNA polymerase sigma factor (sigma-70 family)